MPTLPGLPALQRLFEACLTNVDGDGPPAAMLALTRSDARAGAAQRFAVYAYAYRARLLEALQQDFPALHALVGEAMFDRLGRRYIEAHPSTTPSLRWFGRHYAEFLRRAEPGQPLWSETAAFEWAQGEVFDAPDVATVGLAVMASIPPRAWADMRLLMHPSLHLLPLCWNVPARVAAQSRGEPLPDAVENTQPVTWLLWRRDLDIHWRALSIDEAAALGATGDNASFGEICECLCEWIDPDQVALHAAGLLKRWLNDGLIVDIEGLGIEGLGLA